MYEQRVDRANPGCVVFLIDESHSMKQNLAGTQTSKSAIVAEQLNLILMELIQRCSKSPTEPPRPYFGVSVIGYCTDQRGTPIVGSRLQGALATEGLVWTTDLALHPLRLEDRQRTAPDGSVLDYRMPVWIEASAFGGTPMCAALDHAGRIAHSWVQNYPNGFPPIVVNLTDGEATDGDPIVWAERLVSLRTTDGNLLMFNIGLSDDATQEPIMFPSDTRQISSQYGRVLFDMSSPLPQAMLTAAAQQGYPVQAGARGIGLNADLRSIVSFLNVGTSVGHLLR